VNSQCPLVSRSQWKPTITANNHSGNVSRRQSRISMVYWSRSHDGNLLLRPTNQELSWVKVSDSRSPVVVRITIRLDGHRGCTAASIVSQTCSPEKSTTQSPLNTLCSAMYLYPPDAMIRYDTRCYFNVRSKADMSQLNLPHGTDTTTKKCKTEKKTKK